MNSWPVKIGIICLVGIGAAPSVSFSNERGLNEMGKLKAKIERLSPIDITADTSTLSPQNRKALDKIVAAATYMNAIFLRQVWPGNVALLHSLEQDRSPLGQLRLRLFLQNAGPWSRLDKDEPLFPGVPQTKPEVAGFYPAKMTRDEFNAWVKTLSPKQKEAALGFFTVIRRDPHGHLEIIPYSQEYRRFLLPSAKLLEAAAKLTDTPSLKKFLELRAKAFLSNDYYDSDIAWMDLDSPLEITIGPYETYEDKLFNYKAAFEAFIALRDDKETAKLSRFGGYLQEIEDHLPIDPKYRNPKLGAMAPIRVVNEVYAAGDARRGVTTAAYNLPNDDRVIQAKGSKRVMLKNVQEAKFETVLLPIAHRVIEKSEWKDVAFDPFFTHILMHELMHGLGPHAITVDGKATSVRLELKDQYSAIEEAKADITGLFAMQYLIDKGALGKSLQHSMYTTYLASMFRSVRFGINEAHGKGTAMQFNYLMDHGGIIADEKAGTFRIVPDKIQSAVRSLDHELLTIEAEGSYAKAQAILNRYAVIRPAMRRALAGLSSVPIDIEPTFPLAHETAGSYFTRQAAE